MKGCVPSMVEHESIGVSLRNCGGSTAVFFFFKQKTAYEIKECDWSSDVCSSDLIRPFVTVIVVEPAVHSDLLHRVFSAGSIAETVDGKI